MKNKKIIISLVSLIVFFTVSLKTYALTMPCFSISSNNYSAGDKLNFSEKNEIEVEENLQLYGLIIYENDFDPENPDNVGIYVYEKVLNGVIWESDDISVATVDENGKLTGVSEGKTTIRATYNGESANYEINVKSKSNYDYITLKQMMQEAIDSKDFSDLANQYLMEIFEHLYNNYPSYQKVYKDLPNVDVYIKNNLIDIIGKLKTITLYESGTPEANEFFEEMGMGATDMDGNIELVYNPVEENLVDNLEGLFHEITHNNQNFNGIDIYGILIEGGAVFNAQFVQPYNPTRTSGGMQLIVSENQNVNYIKETSTGNTYAMYLYGYEFLVYTLGYDVMNNCSKGIIETNELIEMLKQKTEINLVDLNKNFMNYLLTPEEVNLSELFEYTKEIENKFLSIMKEGISKADIKNKKMIKQYINIFRDHKCRVMPYYSKNNFFDCWEDSLTYQELNILEVDNVLIDKILESELMVKFTNNQNLNKMAIMSILKADAYDYYKNDDTFRLMKLPHSMDDVLYSYFEHEGKGHLILKYLNASDYSIGGDDISQYIENKENYLEYIFDETNIISVKEPSDELKMQLNDFKPIYRPDEICLKEMPIRKVYCKGEKLNTKGLTLSVKYENTDKFNITEGFECTPNELNEAGKQIITVTYSGVETTFEVQVLSEHEWDEGKITKEPTCTEKGIKSYTCTVCNENRTEEMDATGHSYTEGTCIRCGAVDQSDSIFIDTCEYEITNNIIRGIKANTSVKDFIANIRNNYKVIITKGEKNVTDGLIGTEMRVNIYENSKKIEECTTVVSGDFNGDGRQTVTDLFALKRYLVKIEKPNEYNEQAADLNNDNKMSVTDLIKLKRSIVGLE